MKQLNNSTAERTTYPVKILQFGEGNFLRAFVDWMIAGADKRGVMNHGVAVVQPIPGGEAVEDIFKKQDCLYHVILEGIKDKEPVREITLVDSITEIVNPYREYERYRELFLSDQLETVISNTTEAGIRYEEGDDLWALPPRSFPAKMTALLYERWKNFGGDEGKGLSVICCELIEDNGTTLREYVMKHARYNDLEEGFVQWIKDSCRFYDTLVDRIVTGFPKDDIDSIQKEIGYDDNLVVKGEYFHVWAIGGDPAIREKFPLDKAGYNVLFMDSIKSFRDKKVRILNGSHTAMVPVALQLGCETVRDAFADPQVETYINRMVAEEVLPVIDEDRAELDAFAAKILERFYNPYLRHYLKDISLNSLSKWEARDWPTVKDNYTKLGKEADLCIFSFASLMVLYSGTVEGFTPNDTAEFVGFIQSTFDRDNIGRWMDGIVRHPAMWNDDLTQVPTLSERAAGYAGDILEYGMGHALKALLDA